MNNLPITSWLPITRDEVLARGWQELDVVLVTGDAYVDHPAFGNAVIGRVIENEAFKVAILAQPNWQDDLRDFKKFGKPRLCFAVTAGNMDSMVNHYTANKRLRSDDAYTPGGKAGFRPDYASVVYSKILKELYPDVPIIIGGIEASMRRIAHYDYWSDALKPSVLIESGADYLIYGMGEQPVIALIRALAENKGIEAIRNIPQIGFFISENETDYTFPENSIYLPSFEQCINDKRAFALSFKHIEQESNKATAKHLIQKTGNKTIVINPPFELISSEKLDAIYGLPFTRLPHPKYKKRGDIPAYNMIRHSVTMHRGCFGGCAFCTLSAHQGKFIASRSQNSILKELEKISQMPDFEGHVTDLGGPSANMYQMKGFDLSICAKCKRASCIFPAICQNLNTNHIPITELYRKAFKIPYIFFFQAEGGIRYDMLVGRTPAEDKKYGLTEYTRNLVKHHVSGRLKVAPEHTSDHILKIMRKPSFKLFYQFKDMFDKLNQEEGLRQQIIPYFISSHPGSTLNDMAHLACETKKLGFQLEQVQDFTPTPLTLASTIYYSGINPYTGETVYTARSKEEKLDQRKFFFWYKPENKPWIRQTLKRLNEPKLAEELLGKSQSFIPSKRKRL